jgi:flavin reductase (DIM6/NTAB) family NADH-FMN oxidoreductase RutF
VYYDSQARAAGDGDAGLPWNPFKALVAPRPIGWISTLTETGVVNLAPFSYFQAVADRPDVVMFSVESQLRTVDGQAVPTDERKDSELNAVASGEFVCNVVSWDLRQAMNLTSIALPHDASEAEVAELGLTPSRRVRPPRITRAPAALECVVVGTQRVRHRGGEHRFQLVFGEVVGIHVDDRYIRDGRVDTAAMHPVMRMGYDEYAVVRASFRMTRPEFDPVADCTIR